RVGHHRRDRRGHDRAVRRWRGRLRAADRGRHGGGLARRSADHLRGQVNRASGQDAPNRKEAGMSTGLRAGRLTVAAAAVSLAGLLLAGPAVAQTQEGTASFYSDKFEGKKTASGQAYDKSALTASHKKLPYGTKVQVTNLANAKSVVVTVIV